MTRTRFLHAADLQLGMRRYYLGDEALPRFMQARIDTLRAMADVARARECEFAVLAGDVFESNRVDRATVGRALDALDAMPCPVFLLPGNHDPLDAGSVYRAPAFERHRRVRVLADDALVEVRPGIEVVGAPWTSKHPRKDLVAAACADLAPADGLRVCVAHGEVDTLFPDRHGADLIRREAADRALASGRIHYLALGHRHSATEVAPRIRYSGAPEATDFDEADSGNVLVVELDRDRCDVEAHMVGRWRFLTIEADLATLEDVDALEARLEKLERKDCTILRLGLRGSLNLRAKARLDDVVEHAGDLFAAAVSWETRSDLAVLPDDLDVSDLQLSGFARATVDVLGQRAAADDRAGLVARDALALLYRLAGGTAR